MESCVKNLKLYSSLAEWWPLLSAPADYAEEAGLFCDALMESDPTIKTVVELGSGGGNNASHMKKRFELTLVDLSPAMLSISRVLNPECEHLEGDMRSFRLGRIFDAVFIHDAIMYLTNLDDVRKALETANKLCKMNGRLLVVPDCFRETFKPKTTHGGHDFGSRALRYLEWTSDPDPGDTNFRADFAYLLRDEAGNLTVESEYHILGLFGESDWLLQLDKAGFDAEIFTLEHSELESGTYKGILGIKRRDA